MRSSELTGIKSIIKASEKLSVLKKSKRTPGELNLFCFKQNMKIFFYFRQKRVYQNHSKLPALKEVE